ncbi:hypothetical protein ABZ892_11410 [Streptomyces sp. NPDC046924]|uniref:hypothetical protein n=1 Tax=Streptomyces sp. NPDC046924 TaxID=3155136 RepID=UPI003407E1FF
MAQDRGRSPVDSPGWTVLCLVWSGWSAASSGPPWVRLGSLVFFVAFAVLLLRHVVGHRRRRKSRSS